MQSAFQVSEEKRSTKDDALSVISTLVNDKRCHHQHQLEETPLMLAVSQPYSEYQRCILGAILHGKHFSECTHCKPICDSRTGDTVLHVACNNGKLKLVQWLIDYEKYDLLCQNNERDIPLHVACHHLQVKIVEFLIRNDNDQQLNFRNIHMRTPVHNLFNSNVYWKSGDRTAIANLLLAQPSVDPNIQDKNGNTVLHLLCQDEDLCNAENVALVLKKCQPNIQNNCKNTILHMLCSREQKSFNMWRYKKVFQQLIKHPDVNPFIKNEHGDTPLHIMLHNKAWWDTDLLNLLVKHSRFDPNIQI